VNLRFIHHCQWRASLLCDRRDYFQTFTRSRGGNDGYTRFDYASFFSGDFLEGVAEPFGVFDADVGDDAG